MGLIARDGYRKFYFSRFIWTEIIRAQGCGCARKSISTLPAPRTLPQINPKLFRLVRVGNRKKFYFRLFLALTSFVPVLFRVLNPRNFWG